MKFNSIRCAVITPVLVFYGIASYAQGSAAEGPTSATDAELLQSKGPVWWYKIRPSPEPASPFQIRVPSAKEQAVVDRASFLLANRAAKVIALLDGDKVLYAGYKAPADSDSMLLSFSIAKTVTSMAIGKAICAGKLKLETKASELIPELEGKALGKATVRDLLRMASGTSDPVNHSNIWGPGQRKEFFSGKLDLLELVTEDRVAVAKSGVFSNYKPGEAFSYKATDPIVLGILGGRAVGLPWAEWMQKSVFDPMGTGRDGLVAQDREHHSHAASGVHLRLEDWMKFALWVKRSSQEAGCFGDYVRAASSTQIYNGGTPAMRRIGKVFAGYGYYIWTENSMALNTFWAVGFAGQRIGWNTKNDRMVIAFSNVENWSADLYDLAKDWNNLGN